jgi:predicted dienelactone hydrolase
MRPFELALMLAALAALLALVLPLRIRHWTQHAALAALLAAAAQALVEGLRWQMVPAYTLVGLLFLGWLAKAGGGQRPKWRPFAAALGGAWLAVAAALPAAIPVFHLPRPSGPYAIGTLTYHWKDADRAEMFTADPSDRREIMVQLWYPAAAQSGGARVPYIEDGRALAPLARLLGLPGFVFTHLRQVETHAVRGAPLADGEGRFPVLVFSHGRGGFRQHNTVLVEELVSHGYIVATIDHPYAAAGVRFPDGRLAAFDPRMFDPERPGHPAFFNHAIPFLAEDVVFTLDRLTALDRTDPMGLLTGRLDLAHVGALGPSLGGAIAATACLRDPRLRACLAMDVFMPADVVAAGLKQPTMLISRDTALMAREGWDPRDVEETATTIRTVFERSPGPTHLVLVPGMFHANYADAPLMFWEPLARRLGLIGPINGRRGLDIVDAYTLAFFDRELKGVPVPLLDGPSQQYPEVVLRTRR